MSSHSTWKYRDYIIQALRDLGGEAHRSRVIRRVHELRKAAGASLPDKFEQTVQQVFESHCGDSDIFCGKPALNLFSWPRGKGSGTWGLNRTTVETYIADRNERHHILSLEEL